MKKRLCRPLLYIMIFCLSRLSFAMEVEENPKIPHLQVTFKQPSILKPPGLNLPERDQQGLFRDFYRRAVDLALPPSPEQDLSLAGTPPKEWPDKLQKYLRLGPAPWGVLDKALGLLSFIGCSSPPPEFMARYYGLHSLDLSKTGLAENRRGLTLLLGVLRFSGSLMRLNLSHNGFTDRIIEETIAGQDNFIAPLKELDLSHNLLTATGEAISFIFCVFNNTLEVVDLSHNSIRLDGEQELALLKRSSLLRPRNFKDFNLEGNPPTRESLSRNPSFRRSPSTIQRF